MPDQGLTVVDLGCGDTAFLTEPADVAVEDLLGTTMASCPHAPWPVTEADHPMDDRRTIAHAPGPAYCDPYFPLYAITEQRLDLRQFRDEVSDRACLEAAACDHPDEDVDCTALPPACPLHRSTPA